MLALLFAVLPPTASKSKANNQQKLEETCRKIDEEESPMSSMATNSSQSSRRLIKADFSLFKVSTKALAIVKSSPKRNRRNWYSSHCSLGAASDTKRVSSSAFIHKLEQMIKRKTFLRALGLVGEEGGVSECLRRCCEAECVMESFLL